ncbi:MAG: abortive infection protein [Methanobacteriales archaeon Met13]
MHLFSTATKRNIFLKLILKIILILVLIQLFRALVLGILWFAFGSSKKVTLFQFFNGLSFIIVGIILVLWCKPSSKDMGLNWGDLRLRIRIIYLAGIVFLIFMALTPYTLSWELNLLILGVVFGLVIPAFEELLFRGYIWGKIENSLEMAERSVLTWIIVTLLFSIWHLGYLDVFIIHPLGGGNLIMLLASKLAIGLVLGLLVGYTRLKTRKTYASFLLHGLWNVFGP